MLRTVPTETEPNSEKAFGNVKGELGRRNRKKKKKKKRENFTLWIESEGMGATDSLRYSRWIGRTTSAGRPLENEPENNINNSPSSRHYLNIMKSARVVCRTYVCIHSNRLAIQRSRWSGGRGGRASDTGGRRLSNDNGVRAKRQIVCYTVHTCQ